MKSIEILNDDERIRHKKPPECFFEIGFGYNRNKDTNSIYIQTRIEVVQ